MDIYNGNKGLAPMSFEEACKYYFTCYENGIFSLIKLQIKHRDGEIARPAWEKHRKKGIYGKRDYQSYENMQKALKHVIKEIQRSKFPYNPVPDSINSLDLELEEKKITIAHRTLLCTCRRSILGYGDDYYHNLRAYLINRVEQASGSTLIVDFQGEDNGNGIDAAIKIRDRKEYLIEKYGSCQSNLCSNCSVQSCQDRIR